MRSRSGSAGGWLPECSVMGRVNPGIEQSRTCESGHHLPYLVSIHPLTQNLLPGMLLAFGIPEYDTPDPILRPGTGNVQSGERPMDRLGIDVTTLVAIWMGTTVVLAALGGLTLRFAVRPMMESFARTRAEREHAALEARLARVERALAELDPADRGIPWGGPPPRWLATPRR